MSSSGTPFSEREFYLAEFRGRTIGIAWPSDEIPSKEVVERLLPDLIGELVANGTRVVLMTSRDDVLGMAGEGAAIEVDLPSRARAFEPKPWAPELWRTLRDEGCAALRLSPHDDRGLISVRAQSFEVGCQRLAVALRLAKVIWIQSTPPVYRERSGEAPPSELAASTGAGAVSRAGSTADQDGPSSGDLATRVSVVDLAHLDPLLDRNAAAPELGFSVRRHRKPLLEAIRGMIRGGVPSVNVCAAAEIEQELLTYAGAGVFFTRDRYAEIRQLALDDFDQANDLIARGEADGFLLPRDQASRDRVLAHGVGLFIEGRYLAGIGAVLPYSEATGDAVEIVSLYALTRYAGEGVGSQIVAFAVERARQEGFSFAFCCTTSERVAEFFERHGFKTVPHQDVPASKWDDYDAARRSRVICLRVEC